MYGLGDLPPCNIPASLTASPTWTQQSYDWWALVNNCVNQGAPTPLTGTQFAAKYPQGTWTGPVSQPGGALLPAQQQPGPVTAPLCPPGQSLFGGKCQAIATPTDSQCPPGWTTVGSIPPGTCYPIEQPAPPVVITPTPVKVPIDQPIAPASPTCIGADYTVNAQGQCVYPAGGPTGGYSPPLVTVAPTTSTFTSEPPTFTCPDGAQPDLMGQCPVAVAPAAPTPLQTFESYLTNPWVIGGGVVLLYLATRKKSRRRRT